MSRKPEFITFTGIDDRTDLQVADALSTQYPIEWGVLFSANNRDARFPCSQAVSEILSISGKKAAHLCGQLSRDAQAGIIKEIPLDSFDRVQINGFKVDHTHFDEIEAQYGVEVIHQVRAEGFDLGCKALQLFDCSGGEGALPHSVPQLPGVGKLVGYAGGIGPESVHYYLSMIQGDGAFWIDMEGRVRSNGWFDLSKVQQVCELVYGDGEG